MVVSTNVADDILPKKLFTVDVIIVKVGAIPPQQIFNNGEYLYLIVV